MCTLFKVLYIPKISTKKASQLPKELSLTIFLKKRVNIKEETGTFVKNAKNLIFPAISLKLLATINLSPTARSASI